MSKSWAMTVDPKLDKLCQDLAQKAAPTTHKILQEESDQFLDDVRRKWPVGDGKPEGHSRDKFSLRVVATPEGLRALLENTSSYAGYIKEPWPNKANVARKLFFSPAKDLSLRIARRIAAEVSRG